MRRASIAFLLLAFFLGLGLTTLGADDDDDDDAPTDLDRVDPSSPNLKTPAYLQGEKLERFEKAVAAFKRGRLEYLARKRSSKATLDGAVALLKRCREDDARNALPHYYLGIAWQLLGDPKKALAPLLAAIEKNPKFHEAMIELGDSYLQDGRMKEADAQYARALATKPDHAGALLRRARVKIHDGKFPDARADVQKVLEKRPREALAKLMKKKLDLVIDGPTWPQRFEKETAHYIIRTDADQTFADWVAHHAELIRRLYDSIFKGSVPEGGPKKFPIIVYKNKEEYHKNGGPKGAGGHYDPEFRQLYLFRYEKDSDTTLVLYHEGFHQYLDPYVKRAPQWFNEGLADYFGPAQYAKEGREEGMRIVPNPWRLRLIQHVLGQNGARPLKQLMLMSQAEMYEEETVGVNYAQAWSFIYFLCEYDGRKYFPILGRYFKELKKGKDNEAAYKESFGKEDMDVLEAEWKKFILSLR